MKYRKKPIVIEARQLTLESVDAVKAWMKDACIMHKLAGELGTISLAIKTIEGAISIGVEGDWIIRGVKGEFYPCKPDVFEMTYEKV